MNKTSWRLACVVVLILTSAVCADAVQYQIIDLGQIVGKLTVDVNKSHACLHQNGAIQDLGTVPGYNSLGIAINNKEQIAVAPQSYTSGYGDHPAIWQNGTFTELGILGGYSASHPLDINESGHVV